MPELTQSRRRFWALFASLAAGEVLMGAVFYPILLLREAGSAWCEVLRYLIVLGKIVGFGLAMLLILTLTKEKGTLRGWGMAGLCLLTFTVRDLTGNLISAFATLGDAFEAWDLVLYALLQTALNTLLYEGACLALLYLLSLHLLRRGEARKNAPVSLSADATARALAVSVGGICLSDAVWQVNDWIRFGEEHFWLLTAPEIFTMIFDLFWTLLSGVISLIICYIFRKKVLKK